LPTTTGNLNGLPRIAASTSEFLVPELTSPLEIRPWPSDNLYIHTLTTNVLPRILRFSDAEDMVQLETHLISMIIFTVIKSLTQLLASRPLSMIAILMITVTHMFVFPDLIT